MSAAFARVNAGARRIVLLAVIALAAALFSSAGAEAAGGPTATWWHLAYTSVPTNIAPGGEGTITITASNLGDVPIKGTEHPIVIRDMLPAGVEPAGTTPPKSCFIPTNKPKEPTVPLQPQEPICATRVPKRGNIELKEELEKEAPIAQCKILPAGKGGECVDPQDLAPYEAVEFAIHVKVNASVPEGATGEVNQASVELEHLASPHASLARALKISSEPVKFGVESYEFSPEGETGEIETQAGAHPFQLTTNLQFNRAMFTFANGLTEPSVPELVKNVHVNLPPGFLGNPLALKQCSDLQFATLLPTNLGNECPADTAIGAGITTLNEPHNVHALTVAVPLFNLVPARGEPARFGFVADGVPVTLDAIDKGGDFHVTVGVSNIPQSTALLGSQVTIWGIPGDPRHDISRGTDCLAGGYDGSEGTFVPTCEPQNEESPPPFLSLPTSCQEPLQTTVEAQSWAADAGFLTGLAPAFTGEASGTPQITGCSALPFAPSISIKPQETSSNTPTGLKVLLKVPQETLDQEKGLAEADIRNTVVKLPVGMQLSPSAADGLQACSLSEIGWKGTNPQTGTQEFLPEEARLESEETEAERATKCPKASKVGTVRVKTPVLKQELHGSVYLAAQEENPFHSLFGIYIVIKDPESGVVAKLAGKVELDKATGQVTSDFANAPQLPFEELELELDNGPRASLATPRSCGTYGSSVEFTPWSGTAPTEGASDELGFGITSGPEGTGCASPQPFAPQFVAGMESQQAGAFSGFHLTLVRGSTEQAVKGLTVSLPPGIAAMIANVPRCPEPQASQGTCGPESLIGTATAEAGLGSDPYQITGGKVYLTGPYAPPGGATAPFGLSVVIPANAGGTPEHPVFHFGNVVTRSAIYVNSSTAAVTIVSHLPTMVETTEHPEGVGVPVQLRRVDVDVSRPSFQFNPTNCTPKTITASVEGDEGAQAPESEPFQVSGCSNLAFSPTLEAEVEQHWTKLEGTGMKITVRATPGQANIQKTKIVFPEQLPSRLTTIQKACPEATFDANPASCPEGSVIGFAKAYTPVLNSPLVGPAYLVSHGGAEFPDAEFVLQGEGVLLVLDGQTNIHKGITSSTFNAVPDAPVNTFEVTLPRGPHSAFTGYGELCNATKAVTKTVTVKETVGKKGHKHTIKVKKKVTENVSEKLKLPTILGGQNGDVIEENLPLKITGCQAVKSSKVTVKPKKKTKAKAKKKKKK